MNAPTGEMHRLAYKLKDFAAKADMNPRTARDLAQRGELPAHKVGRHWYVGVKVAEEWFEPKT